MEINVKNEKNEKGESKELSVTRIRNEGKEWVDVFKTFSSGDQSVKVDQDEAEHIDTSKTWEDIEWDDVKADVAQRVLKDEVLLDQDIVDNYELETSDKWDKFYMKNQQNFFKNRNYLGKEFPELSGPGSFPAIDTPDCYHWDRDTLMPTVCEIGCGVGNSIVPLMELNTDKYFIGFDCSSTAVEIFQKREEFQKERCHLFVLDPTTENMNMQVPNNSVDIAILIFVLSAIAPKHMPNVLQQIYACLKPGGILLFRDYGQYDMTHLRFFAKKNPNKMAENYYRREDGTFAYFFEKEATNELFSAAGFTCENTCYDTRVLYNRKRMLKMYRVWIRGRFRKPIQ